MKEVELMACRICKGEKLEVVCDLGYQVITSRWPLLGDNSTPKTLIVLVQCLACGLVQLQHSVDGSELYEHQYGYRSGISNTMRAHLKAYNDEIQAKQPLAAGDTILDIGSNDTTFLRNYPTTLRRIGCDPTGKQFRQYYTDGLELVANYFTKGNVAAQLGDGVRFKVVSSISMFYDLPDPVQFARDVCELLEDDGIWTLEQSYVLTMLQRNSVDTICHEHLEYYGVRQIKEIMDRAGLKIIDLTTNDCNGGSFRIYAAKRASAKHTEATEAVARFLQLEKDSALEDPATFKKFLSACDVEVNKLTAFIDAVNANGQKMYIYGASTKGNCLLQYADIGSSKIKYAVERNLEKVGKMTSTGIEIISEDTMRSQPPEYLLVLPWHFRDEIIVRESEFLAGGGQLVFPFPQFEIVAK